MKVCDKTCIFCFFSIISKYLCMTKRSSLSELPTYFRDILAMHGYMNVKFEGKKKKTNRSVSRMTKMYNVCDRNFLIMRVC